MKFTIEKCLDQLPLKAYEKWREGLTDIETFVKEGLNLVFFAPRGTENRMKHEGDEFYFVASGNGQIVIEDQRFRCENGDAFYIPAKTEYYFDNFTDDFATWAVFA